MKQLTARAPSAWLLAALLTPVAGLADQLVMQNGDSITGDITAIADGKVTIQPAYSDPFAVHLADVASIEADGAYGVVLDNGQEVQAQFAGSANTSHGFFEGVEVHHHHVNRLEVVGRHRLNMLGMLRWARMPACTFG